MLRRTYRGRHVVHLTSNDSRELMLQTQDASLVSEQRPAAERSGSSTPRAVNVRSPDGGPDPFRVFLSVSPWPFPSVCVSLWPCLACGGSLSKSRNDPLRSDWDQMSRAAAGSSSDYVRARTLRDAVVLQWPSRLKNLSMPASAAVRPMPYRSATQGVFSRLSM